MLIQHTTSLSTSILTIVLITTIILGQWATTEVGILTTIDIIGITDVTILGMDHIMVGEDFMTHGIVLGMDQVSLGEDATTLGTDQIMDGVDGTILGTDLATQL